MDRDRAAFERWYRKDYWNFTEEYCRFNEDFQKYNNLNVQLAWASWQAASAFERETNEKDRLV